VGVGGPEIRPTFHPRGSGRTLCAPAPGARRHARRKMFGPYQQASANIVGTPTAPLAHVRWDCQVASVHGRRVLLSGGGWLALLARALPHPFRPARPACHPPHCSGLQQTPQQLKLSQCRSSCGTSHSAPWAPRWGACACCPSRRIVFSHRQDPGGEALAVPPGGTNSMALVTTFHWKVVHLLCDTQRRLRTMSTEFCVPIIIVAGAPTHSSAA